MFEAIVRSAVGLCGGMSGNVWRLRDDALELVASHNEDARLAAIAREAGQRRGLDRSLLAGRAILDRAVVNVPDVSRDPEYDPELARRNIPRGALSVPMLKDGAPIGAITVARSVVGLFSEQQIALLQGFAAQAVIAIENVRLFRELEQKSRELEVASQHKSKFLANMSHELRNPLNAIIGFSEVLSERIFGDLKDLPTALDSALTLVRERAGRRGITLESTADERLGEVRADERKIRQVVLNLLSNAIKFTPEGGRIEVAAVPKDGSVELSVSDTGVGIALEDQEAVFEEFRQVGASTAKQEGTGLGLALCRKFVELHGGKIGATSQVGVGSTFTFSIPFRPGG